MEKSKFTKIGRHRSELAEIRIEIVQGSRIGRSIFGFYVNDIFQLALKMQSDLVIVNKWLKFNLLVLTNSLSLVKVHVQPHPSKISTFSLLSMEKQYTRARRIQVLGIVHWKHNAMGTSHRQYQKQHRTIRICIETYTTTI